MILTSIFKELLLPGHSCNVKHEITPPPFSPSVCLGSNANSIVTELYLSKANLQNQLYSFKRFLDFTLMLKRSLRSSIYEGKGIKKKNGFKVLNMRDRAYSFC